MKVTFDRNTVTSADTVNVLVDVDLTKVEKGRLKTIHVNLNKITIA